MKKKYIKPIIECCHLETTIIAISVDPAISTAAADSGKKNYVNNPNGQDDEDIVPGYSKDNFWNLWEDDDMEFEL